MVKTCELGVCENDPKYPDTPVIPPLPEDGGGGGGGGDGHKYTFRTTATGWEVLEDGKVIYRYTDKDTNTTYTWQATADGWLVKDNTGKVIFNYTDKSGENTTYTFEQKGVDFDVKDNNGKVVFNYKGTTDTNTTYTWSNYKDGFKVTDDKGVVVYTYDPNLGKNSDGSYAIDTLLSTVFKGHTTISTGQITGFDPANLVVGETLVYDGVGSVGVITKDNGNGTYQVTTMTISPGTRQGVRLGSVENVADLPATCADAEAKGWQTPQLGDFAYVTKGGQGDEISEYVITSDTDCNLTWTFSHSFNAGDYQSQSTTAMAGMILTGGAVQGTFGTPIDPKTLIRGVMRNGILLTPDAQGKVNVVVDDSHIIVNALPTTNIVDKAEYIVIDANQKVTGTWVHDATGWYQTYAVVNPVASHQIVKDLPTADINDEVEYVQVGDLDDPMNTFVATWIHTDNGWVKTGESVKAQKAHIAVTALPTTNINENAEYLVMTDTSDPDTLTGTWVRVNGNWVQTEKVENGYHLVTALPTTDIDDKSHYVVVGDLAQPDTTFLGEFVYDKTANKWIDLKGSTEITYNIGRDGQELKSADAVIAGGDRFTSISGGQRIPFVNRPNSTIDQAGDGTWIVPPHSKVEVIMSLALYNANGGSEPNGEWCVREVGYTGTDRNDPRYILGVDPYDHRSSASNAPGWSLNRTASGHYTNTTDNPVTIEAVCLSIATAGTQIYNATSHITVQEIGRVVDPIAYMLNDGNAQEMPVGSLIQTMSNSAPKHYLICDGSEYAIGTYPELEAHFVKEFGAVNHFGGENGKWKVPDLRGEFLRMTGASGRTFVPYGTQELSVGAGADVGEHQDPTYHPANFVYSSNSTAAAIHVGVWDASTNRPMNGDSEIRKSSQFHDQLYSSSGTREQSVGLTTRPTNTSVNVAIKCESTPRVVIDQGTYKVSVPFTITANNSTVTLDVANAVDDTTMVKDSTHLVAPVDGYYAIGTQINGAGDWLQQMSLYITRSNLGVWQSGVGVTGVFKLQAGDEVEFCVSKVGSKPKSGYLNMALVNTVADHKVAEMMQKPNLWTPGVEQSFGDGVYGMRVSGTFSSSTSQDNLAQLGAGAKTISFGGSVSNASTNWSLPFVNANSTITAQSIGVFTSSTGGLCVRIGSDMYKGKYDIWCLYTKD